MSVVSRGDCAVPTDTEAFELAQEFSLASTTDANSVGSRIRVRLYSGKEVEAKITAITNQSAGRKIQIVYGNVTAIINPPQIIEVL
jgi:hypothetical protein